MHECSGLVLFLSSVYDGVIKQAKHGRGLNRTSSCVVCVVWGGRGGVRLMSQRGGRTRRSLQDFTRLLRLWLERRQGSGAWLAHVAQRKKENTTDPLFFFSSSLKSSRFPHGMTPKTLELAFTALAWFIRPCLGPSHIRLAGFLSDVIFLLLSDTSFPVGQTV